MTSCKRMDSNGVESCFELLPDDVIYLILKFLQPGDLCRICCVNKRFHLLAHEDSVWHLHAKRRAVVMFPSHSYRKDCSAKELCRIAPHWMSGKYTDKLVTKHAKRLIPWIQKTEKEIWYSIGNTIQNFQVRSLGHLYKDNNKALHGMEEDATRFVLKKNLLISGCRDGGVYAWDTSGKLILGYRGIHRSDIQCLDATDHVIITGSRDATCKIVPLEAPNDDKEVQVLRTFDTWERVWSLKISPCQRVFAAGLAGDVVPACIWDVETGASIGKLGVDHRKGSGVLDLWFDSPHQLLTCGYDTFLRLWDLRTLTCVTEWEEPHDSALYSMVCDGANTIAVGTARHGMVRLWDRRQTEPIQAYYSNRSSSPVYSLAMDYGNLYLALDLGLNVMEFVSGNTRIKTPPRNWRNR